MNKKILSRKDKEAIFEKNTGLIWGVINKKYNSLENIKEDMFQVGAMALWRAIDTFDYDNGAEFSTYATTCIYSKIKTFVMNESNTYYSYDSINYKLTMFIMRNKNDMECNKLWEEAKKTFGDKINHQMFNTFYAQLTGGTTSIYDIEGSPIEDISINISNDIEGEMMYEYYIDMIKNIDRCSDRDKKIFMEYISNKMNGGDLTLQSLGQKYSISKQRVDQIVRKIAYYIAIHDIIII